MNDSPAAVIYDPTGTNGATVKAASSAPVATDTALVVSVSPNSPASLPSDTVATGTLGAANAAVTVAMNGQRSVGIQVAAGTLIGTLVAEMSFDNATWNATNFDIPANSTKQISIVFASSNTATAATIVGVGGCGYARVRVSAYTSGTANATVRASLLEDPTVLFTAPPAAALPPDCAMTGGSDGTYIRAISTDNTGRQNVLSIPMDGARATYSACIAGFAPVATTPTDIFTITGSSTMLVRVTRIAITATQTTAAIRDVLLIKRSTANSGGTSAAVTAVQHDTTSAAATASVLSYTANPTVGTTTGNVRARKLAMATTAATTSDEIVWEFGNRPSMALVIRGSSQVLAINLNSVASSGNLFNIYMEWTESLT